MSEREIGFLLGFFINLVLFSILVIYMFLTVPFFVYDSGFENASKICASQMNDQEFKRHFCKKY